MIVNTRVPESQGALRIGVPGTGRVGTTIATTLVSLGDEAMMRHVPRPTRYEQLPVPVTDGPVPDLPTLPLNVPPPPAWFALARAVVCTVDME